MKDQPLSISFLLISSLILSSPGDPLTCVAPAQPRLLQAGWVKPPREQSLTPSRSPTDGSRPAGISAGWWAAAQQEIRRSEYQITWQDYTYLSDVDAAYHAPNRAQNLRTYFTPGGIHVVPRTDGGGAWRLGLSLAGYSPPQLVADANRVQYRRGDVVERYTNGEGGLEQRLTLSRPPMAGNGPRSAVTLNLLLTGDLTPSPVDDTTLEFTTADGTPVLRYSGLRAADATGRDLPARLTICNHQSAICILVDPTSGVYPLTLSAAITGLSTTPDWTAEGDQASAQFGHAVATAGDVNNDGYSDMVVGAHMYDLGQTDEGVVFVYYGSAAGLPASPSETLERNQAGAQFGFSVATAGNATDVGTGSGYADVIVGAPLFDSGYGTDAGRAFIYEGSASGLVLHSWFDCMSQAGSQCGYSVATAGDVSGDGWDDVVVGSPFADDPSYTDAGAIQVYYGSQFGVDSTPDWSYIWDQAGAQFGYSVATAGDVDGDGLSDVIVGAPGYNNGQTDEGRAYLFSPGVGPDPAWSAEGNQTSASFGTSVSTAGDVNGDGYSDVIVGAYLYDNGQTDEGRAYVYHGSASGLSTSANWTAEPDQQAHFGRSVSTAGDVNGDGYADVIVGAHWYTSDQSKEGGAFVYHGSASGLSGTADWTAESDQAEAYLGFSVGTAGDVNGDGYSDVIAGAYLYDDGETDEGAAFLYHGSPGGLSQTAAWTAESNQANAYFGNSVSTAGDVNGDGYADVVVGARLYDNGQTNEGRAYAYYGSATGLSTTPDWMAEGNQTSASFGHSVSTAGDVNGDGYADVIVGAPDYDNGQEGEGQAYVYYGSPTGIISTTADWIAESNEAMSDFGTLVSTAGDVNGDGYADVIVGASNYRWPDYQGAAFAYYGSASGLSASPDWVVESGQDNALFGIAVSTAGDVNGDGYSDVLVGASGYDGDLVDEGQAYLYLGSADGLETSAAWAVEGDQADALYGESLSTAGDVNGDGYADVIVGASLYNGGLTDEGRACLYLGSAAGLATTPDWVAEGDQSYARYGNAVGTAGDVNGDGYADVIVGAWTYVNGQDDEGAAFVYHGSAAGLSSTADWTAEGNLLTAQFGSSAGAAGDVNGDGYADVIVGAQLYENGQTWEGRTYVYYGNGGDGLDVLPRQMRADGSAPIAPLGTSDSGAFQLRLVGHSPAGREEVGLQWEVAPLGTPFTSTAVVRDATGWFDTGTTGVVISQTVSGLALGNFYHWRVRLLYRPGNRLGQPAGRWIHIPWNSWSETDLCTQDEPIAGLVATNDSPTPLGNATTLTASITAGSNVAYTWDLGDGAFDSSAMITHTYSAIDVYTAVVTASNALSVTTATTTITITDVPIAGLVATNDSPTVVGNVTALTTTITAGTNVTYTWDLGDDTFSSGPVAIHIYPDIGTYTATVTATNSMGSASTATIVTIEPRRIYLPLVLKSYP